MEQFELWPRFKSTTHCTTHTIAHSCSMNVGAGPRARAPLLGRSYISASRLIIGAIQLCRYLLTTRISKILSVTGVPSRHPHPFRLRLCAVSASTDRALKVWDLGLGCELRTLLGTLIHDWRRKVT